MYYQEKERRLTILINLLAKELEQKQDPEVGFFSLELIEELTDLLRKEIYKSFSLAVSILYELKSKYDEDNKRCLRYGIVVDHLLPGCLISPRERLNFSK